MVPCMCLSVLAAGRSMSRLYDQHLGEVGLRSTQYSLLRAIAEVSDRRAKLGPGDGGVGQGELARLLTTDPTTLSRTLAPLASDGLIRRVAGDDRRERRWTVTPKGRGVLGRALGHWEQAQRSAQGRLSASDWDLLRSLLGRLVMEATA